MQDPNCSLSNLDTATRSHWTVLNVEDNPANVLMMELIIGRRSDLKLVTATNGRQGIEMACALLPDVILMDIVLPDINGREALAILLGNPKTSHIPVIALSSDAYPDQIKKGLKAGFFHYLTKPYRLTDLMAAIDMAVAVKVA